MVLFAVSAILVADTVGSVNVALWAPSVVVLFVMSAEAAFGWTIPPWGAGGHSADPVLECHRRRCCNLRRYRGVVRGRLPWRRPGRRRHP